MKRGATRLPSVLMPLIVEHEEQQSQEQDLFSSLLFLSPL